VLYVANVAEEMIDKPNPYVDAVQAVADIEAKHFGVYRLSDDERAAVREGLAQAARGEFVPDDIVEAYFKKYRA
jgi:predicted transcriptional regulator